MLSWLQLIMRELSGWQLACRQRLATQQQLTAPPRGAASASHGNCHPACLGGPSSNKGVAQLKWGQLLQKYSFSTQSSSAHTEYSSPGGKDASAHSPASTRVPRDSEFKRSSQGMGTEE